MTVPHTDQPVILLTGATGYVGGKLLAPLLTSGRRIRCLVRPPAAFRPEAEVVAGDVLDPPSLQRALEGVYAAYYLVHSMASAGSFEDQDRCAARNFAEAARAAGVRRIIYLGGLGEEGDRTLSPHLRSRHEVGDLLRASGVPVIEFRASIVIGSGSLSFEMIRALVERLPVMIAPRWVGVPAQPIAIHDLLQYLLEALDLPLEGSRVFEIGGSDQVSYGDLLQEYARQRGLKRLLLPVPLLTPRLSSLWLGLVTPLYVRVGRKLIDSIRHASVVRDRSALGEFPIRPVGYRAAIAAALQDGGGRLIDSRVVDVEVPSDRAFASIRRIGGVTGWYYGDWMWRWRGVVDEWLGGVGMRRGRRDPENLAIGDTVDCWRVEAFEPDCRLRLAAEMKLPGRAWLEYEVTRNGAGSVIRQTALFDPLGLGGRAYWYLSWPWHRVLFAGMLQAIARAATGPPHA